MMMRIFKPRPPRTPLQKAVDELQEVQHACIDHQDKAEYHAALLAYARKRCDQLRKDIERFSAESEPGTAGVARLADSEVQRATG
jgi:hypothetical protein